MPQFSAFGRYLSILDRLMRMYYDHGLSGFEIGWGQQFYVEYLYDHPGASAQEMAACIRVDKATLTKTIQKLTQVGYVRAAADERDRRVKHLYLTDKAVPAAQRIKQIHAAFLRRAQRRAVPGGDRAGRGRPAADDGKSQRHGAPQNGGARA